MGVFGATHGLVGPFLGATHGLVGAKNLSHKNVCLSHNDETWHSYTLSKENRKYI